MFHFLGVNDEYICDHKAYDYRQAVTAARNENLKRCGNYIRWVVFGDTWIAV